MGSRQWSLGKKGRCREEGAVAGGGGGGVALLAWWPELPAV